MTQNYIIDRIEGDFAVAEGEGRVMTDIPLSDLPTGIKEGDTITINEDGTVTVGAADNSEVKSKISELMGKLWAD